MERCVPEGLNLENIETPAFAVDLALLEENARIIADVGRKSGAKVLLALKGFAMFSTFDLLRPYLQGCCASSVNEALLAREEMNLQVHSYSPAYSEKDLKQLLEISDHLIFNSPAQWERFAALRESYKDKVSFGLRFNPSHSETDTLIYDPSAPKSRLGSIADQIPQGFLKQVEGLHIHNLCEKNADHLIRTWQAVERQLGSELEGLKWINLGGGHHITRQDYDREALISLVRSIRSKYKVDVYLEPGEAWALNTGFLISTVLDTLENRGHLAVLDTSASCHMPDVLEMPYRPHILGSADAEEKKYTYRLGGMSCLAGDVIGDYSFDRPLESGDKLVFTDMAHYSMVKTNSFNGINLPSLYLYDSRTKEQYLVKKFSYTDFKGRLS